MAQKINVDVTPGLFQQTLYYHQGDVGREFEIAIVTKDGYEIPSGATFTIQATKPSGFGFTVTGTATGNVVAFTSTEEMTDEFGRFPAQLKIADGTDTIFTANFLMVGEIDVHPDGTTDGSQETIIPTLTLLVERVENAAAAVLDTTTEVTTLPAGSQATYSFDEETNTATFGIPQGEAGAGSAGVVASAYSASKTYAVGDYAIHNSNLYRCTTAITTAESFTASHWTQVVLADDVTDLKSDYADLPYIDLFDLSACTSGYYINVNNGSEVASSGWYISNYIPISVDALLEFGGYADDKPVVVGVGYYDSNRQYINTSSYSASVLQNGYFEQFPQNTAYVRFSLSTADLQTFYCKRKKLASYHAEQKIPAINIKGIESIKYVEDDAVNGYWNTSAKEIITHSAYKATPLIKVKQGDILYTKHAGSRTFVLYSDEGAVLDYRNLSGSETFYHGMYRVIGDGVLGCSFVASNSDYEVQLNGERIITKAFIDWLDLPSNTSWSTWVGKKAIMFGDSLVSGQRDDSAQGGAYCRRLKEHLSLTDCVNEGRSGHPVADGTPNGAGTVSTVLSVTDYSSYDLVIVAGGTNDFKLNVPIGSISAIGGTFDRNTFYGALQTIFEYLMSKKANIRTCMWTPLQRNNDGYDIYYTNSAGHKLSDYCDAIKEVGKLYSVPVVDMYNISGVNMLDLSYYTVDGLHLNGAGYDIVSYIGAKQINVL